MDDTPMEGLSSLVRLSGVNVPARARFVGEAMIQSSLTSITLGLVCGQAGGMLMTTTGPLVPFLVGSWAGYTVGLMTYWYGAKRLAITYAQQYPTILAHALSTERMIEVPKTMMQEVNPEKLEQWIVEGGLPRLSASILAAQACRNDVEELERQERQRLMEEHQERRRESAS
jgi:hypothetical protein